MKKLCFLLILCVLFGCTACSSEEQAKDRNVSGGKSTHHYYMIGTVLEIEDALKKYGINWANFVKEAGIDGEFFCKRAVFLVNDLDVQDKKNLDFIRETAWKLGRPPLKKELPDIRIRNLLQKCGSYRNVLFQIGLEPVEKKRPFPSSAAKQKRLLL